MCCLSELWRASFSCLARQICCQDLTCFSVQKSVIGSSLSVTGTLLEVNWGSCSARCILISSRKLVYWEERFGEATEAHGRWCCRRWMCCQQVWTTWWCQGTLMSVRSIQVHLAAALHPQNKGFFLPHLERFNWTFSSYRGFNSTVSLLSFFKWESY